MRYIYEKHCVSLYVRFVSRLDMLFSFNCSIYNGGYVPYVSYKRVLLDSLMMGSMLNPPLS